MLVDALCGRQGILGNGAVPGPRTAESKLFHNFAKIIVDKIITKMQHGLNLLNQGDVSRDDPEAKQGAVPAGPVSSLVTREAREISRQALRPVRGRGVDREPCDNPW